MFSRAFSRTFKKVFPTFPIALIVCSLSSTGVAAQTGYQLVVNAENPIETIGKSVVSEIFLGRRSSWPSGLPTRPADQTAEHDVRELFSRDVHGRSVSAIKSHWQRQTFSGRGVPPPEFRTEDAVLQYIRNNAGAVGYVSETKALGSGLKRLPIE